MAEMKHSNVIGAGIVGLATALSLQETGRLVTLIDRAGPGEGTSSGNAGIISVGSIFPEAEPDTWKEIPGMLLQPLAPVRIRPLYLPRFTPWLLRFLSNTGTARFEAGIKAIAALSSRALQHLEPLVAKAGAGDLLRQEGMIYLYENERQFVRARSRIRYRVAMAQDFHVLDGRELRSLEPTLREGLAGGIRIPGAAFTVSPLGLSKKLFELFLRQGGRFVSANVNGFTLSGNRVTGLQMDGPIRNRGSSGSGTRENSAGSGDRNSSGNEEEFFITAGAYSGSLAKQLGSAVPLVTERGYHLMLPDPRLEVRTSLISAEKGLAITPMQEGLRLAGTVEFASLTAAPDYRRAEVLARHAARLLPGLQITGGTPWMGFRPSVPDSVPVISASPIYRNVYFGFGHGHLGLTQAAITGTLLAALASGNQPPVDPEPYRIDRSWW